MFNAFIEIVKDELYALKTRPQRRHIERQLKDPNSTHSINLAKFVADKKNKSL